MHLWQFFVTKEKKNHWPEVILRGTREFWSVIPWGRNYCLAKSVFVILGREWVFFMSHQGTGSAMHLLRLTAIVWIIRGRVRWSTRSPFNELPFFFFVIPFHNDLVLFVIPLLILGNNTRASIFTNSRSLAKSPVGHIAELLEDRKNTHIIG